MGIALRFSSNNLSNVKKGITVASWGTILQCQKDDLIRRLQLAASTDDVYLAKSTDGGTNFTILGSLALKSDLPKYDIKTFTVDVTTQNANSNGKYYTEKKLSTESWYSSAKAIVPLFARKSGSNYICMAEIEYETLRVQADIAISGVTVGILAVS